MSKPDHAVIAKVVAYLKPFPQYGRLSEKLKLLLVSALAEHNLMDTLYATVPEDIVVTVLRGLMTNEDFVQCAIAYALGIGVGVKAPEPDGGGPKTEPVPVSLVDEAERVIALETVPAVPLSALAGLMDASPKVVTADWVERTLTEIRKHPPSIHVGAWLN